MLIDCIYEGGYSIYQPRYYILLLSLSLSLSFTPPSPPSHPCSLSPPPSLSSLPPPSHPCSLSSSLPSLLLLILPPILAPSHPSSLPPILLPPIHPPPSPSPLPSPHSPSLSPPPFPLPPFPPLPFLPLPFPLFPLSLPPSLSLLPFSLSLSFLSLLPSSLSLLPFSLSLPLSFPSSSSHSLYQHLSVRTLIFVLPIFPDFSFHYCCSIFISYNYVPLSLFRMNYGFAFSLSRFGLHFNFAANLIHYFSPKITDGIPTTH
ncbi:unnamed protein product [Acanthosepion pharaonis]|uniref:Uncharacterized protein n=1 Tax=Acanthosepion pharaonis TaxID=158019 RepID=A0A812C6K3_ACAPH|nr:unnamed protein product [Sepia pharaonis]